MGAPRRRNNYTLLEGPPRSASQAGGKGNLARKGVVSQGQSRRNATAASTINAKSHHENSFTPRVTSRES